MLIVVFAISDGPPVHSTLGKIAISAFLTIIGAAVIWGPELRELWPSDRRRRLGLFARALVGLPLIALGVMGLVQTIG